MDNAERERIENEIRDEAERVALALLDFPAAARDIQEVLHERTAALTSRDDLDDWYAIGSVDDHQSDPELLGHRRDRRLAELRFALEAKLGRDYY